VEPAIFPAKSVPQKLVCAADFGTKHSVASILGSGDSYAAKLLGSNTVGGTEERTEADSMM
jgi:hypothetical protein